MPTVRIGSSTEEHLAKPDATASCVPVRTKFFWSFGGFADALMYSGTNALVQQILTTALGLQPLLVSTATAVPRFVDIVLDPVIGYLSDNTRSRWGRRKPWMLVGGLASGLIVMTLWRPPMAWGSAVTFGFLALMLTLHMSGAYGAYTIAHSAMGYE